MSFTDRLPSLRRQPRPTRKHRAVDEVQRLQTLLEGAQGVIKGLDAQLDDTEQLLAAVGSYRAEAEELVVKLRADLDDATAERDQLAEEVAALKRRFAAQLAAEANTHRITVPPMVRDTSALEDQATGPIDVRALWEARDAGLLGPVTDPGRTH